MKRKMQFVTTKAERFSYGLYFFGQVGVFTIVSGFMQIAWTDAGISAATVGVIFLIAKLWDAVNDPLFGVIMDKTRLKGGKYKPWIKISWLLVPLFTIAVFAVPSGQGAVAKAILAGLFYIGWDMSYTISDVPVFALVTSMSKDVPERNRLLAYNRIGGYLGLMLVGIAVPFVYPMIGWVPTAAAMAVVAWLTMFPLLRTAKERYPANNEGEVSVRELLRGLLKNKFLVVFYSATIINGCLSMSAIGNYFYIHALGGPEMIGIISAILLVPSALDAFLMPVLVKRFDKFHLLVFSSTSGIVLSIVAWFVGYASFAAFITVAIIKTLFTGIGGMIGIMFTADCAEYGLYQTGEHSEGVTFSMQTFATKLVVAVSGALSMFILGLLGFVEGAGAMQSPQTIESMWLCMNMIPSVGAAASLLILLSSYKLRDSDVQIMSLVNQDKLTRREAQRLLNKDLRDR
jgi:sugar (glycoside-pentoside-hexuronide) transporter